MVAVSAGNPLMSSTEQQVHVQSDSIVLTVLPGIRSYCWGEIEWDILISARANFFFCDGFSPRAIFFFCFAVFFPRAIFFFFFRGVCALFMIQVMKSNHRRSNFSKSI